MDMKPDSRPTLCYLDDLVRRMDRVAGSLRTEKPETCDCDGCVAARLNEEANGYAE